MAALELRITLTSPPQQAPPDCVASLALHCETVGRSCARILLFDPLTQQERMDLRWYLEEYWMWPYEGFAQRGKEVEQLLVVVGQRLYQAVFGNAQAASLVQAWRSYASDGNQISLISDLPAALSLPWELLHDGQHFLALRADQPVSIVRTLPLKEQREQKATFAPPLRILLITSQPEGTGFVNPRGIARELFDELGNLMAAGAVELEFLRPPTLAALKARLRKQKRPIHILHFDGHGVFGKKAAKQGMLAFEDENGQLDAVKAELVARVLQDSGVRLVVLTACQSAMSSGEDIFSSVAAQLIRCGVDAVVAMSTNVLVTSTTRYAAAFYNALARGIPIAFAHEQARQALHDDPYRHRQRRYRDEPGAPVKLYDWWMPHLYQQQPLALQPTQVAHRYRKQGILSPVPSLNEEMPGEPRYGFLGRARELLKLERWLLQRKVVLISGFGGIGKTSLAREAADWLTRTKLYDVACFVSFEHGGDAAMLLSVLGHFLRIYDGYYNPLESKSSLARLKAAFKKKRTLIITDNLESIQPGGEAPLPPEIRSQLWSVLLELAEIGAGVLLTSRNAAFEEEFMPGAKVAHLSLQGLRPNDAYALASHLLNTLRIDPIRAPYVELRDLLSQLDYHPLAIQLILPALRAMSISTIRTEFADLLPKFVDDVETGRNRSLLASLEYSLQRLSEEQRTLLPRLALFEGGVSEDDLLAITEVPESEWAKLRRALEEAALVVPEQVGNFAAPFLHFHPVLTPYLRRQSGTDDTDLRLRYAQRYHARARHFYFEDDRNPQPVRALLQKELPNLRRALELLLEVGDLDAASLMADSLASFLNIFGLLRERDALRQRIQEAAWSRPESGRLTQGEWLRESGLGQDERQKGNIGAAYTRFSNLLDRIEALPEGAPLGPRSYEHCLTLHWLGRCLASGGQPVAAEQRVREALIVIDALIRQQPENQDYIREGAVLLADLGDALADQGKYGQAQEAYEGRLKIAQQQDDLRGQAVALTQLGSLAWKLQDFDEARLYYQQALAHFGNLGEQASEAVSWHQLGMIAHRQQNWAEAERCYRKSLAIRERRRDNVDAAMTCNNLAIVAEGSGRPAEAERWYKRALELNERVQSGSPSHAGYLNNLAFLLIGQVRAGCIPTARLAEAKGYAEQALTIRGKLDASSEIWTTLSILAGIAELEGRVEEAREYRRRERETFAAFAGNRYHIDQQFGPLIRAIAASVQGNGLVQEVVEGVLPELEKYGWRIAAATRRIWVGERDWHTLAEGLDTEEALLILRVLETLASSDLP